MKITISALGVAILLCASGVSAQTRECDNAVSQSTMTICSSQSLLVSNSALNRDYAVVMARLSPNGKKALRNAQRAWIVFRDKQCFFESNGDDGGSLAAMTANNCARALTDQRATALAALKTCAEGDVACPR